MNNYKPSIGEVKQNNKQAGQYFFSKSTMSFFGKQKMSIVQNNTPQNTRESNESNYLLKIRFDEKRNDIIRYYRIINNGENLIAL